MKTRHATNTNQPAVHPDGDCTILQACEKIGPSIPRFRYSESLSIAGNRRTRLVETEKSPKSMPSCAVRTTHDMRIHTKTNSVKRTRESIPEPSSVNHPSDRPTRDQGGECDLQDQAMIYGSDRGRFYEYKRSVQDKLGGPLIKTIMTRCIHCTRCVRLATEVAGVEALGTTGRGKGMEVGTYITSLFDSESSGNVIDSCPVGALTSKPYALNGRPWELKSIESIDVLDGMGSALRLDTRGSELMRILPGAHRWDRDPANQQWISDKTRSSYDGPKYQRLQYPMVKQNGAFLAVGREIAFGVIPERPRGIKSNDIIGVVGQFVDQRALLYLKNFPNMPGVSKTHTLVTQAPAHGAQVGSAHFLNLDLRSNHSVPGTSFGTQTAEILLIGSNPRYEASLSNLCPSQRQARGETCVASVASPMDLRYRHTHVGNGMRTSLEVAQGNRA